MSDLGERHLLIGSVVLVLIGYAFGRYLQPPRVEERVVERVAEHSAESITAVATSSESMGLARTVATETTYHADGAVTVREEETVAEVREVIREVEVVRTVEVERIVYRDRERIETAALAQWRVGVDVGLSASDRRIPIPGVPPGVPVVAGVTAERRILGPVWAGAWAQTGLAAGVRVSIEF